MQKRYIIRDKCILLFTLLIFSIGTYSLFGNTRGVNFFDLAVYQHRIKGVVTDSGGTPVQGASVRIKGTSTGTFTNSEGVFYLEATPTDVLILSYIGFKKLEVIVGSSEELSLVLEEDVTDLGAVTVNAGYYSVKERERTGSISSISAADIEEQPVTNVLATMQGRMPGVYITQDSGVPGSGFQIQIRGQNSLRSDGNMPLYIVDGVPFTTQSMESFYTGEAVPGIINPLNNIDPTSIASIEVLKDADATAIYGSRGANGVVLITTKKGVAGKTRFQIGYTYGLGRVANFMDLMDTNTYLEMRREAYANDGIITYPANAYDVNGTWDQNRYTDWQEVLIGGTSDIIDATGSVSGGSEHTQFLVNGNYHKETTVYPGDYAYNKFGLNSSINHSTHDEKFKVHLTAGYTIQNNNLPGLSFMTDIYQLAPNAPALYQEDGTLNWENSSWENPYSVFETSYESKTNSLISNLLLSYEPIDGLEFKTSLGYTNNQFFDQMLRPSTVYDPAYEITSEFSNAYKNQVHFNSWIVEPQVSYKKEFSAFKTQLLVGGTFQKQVSSQLVHSTSGYASNSLLGNMTAASFINIATDDQTEYKYNAIFGRLNTSLFNRYFINITGRRDGSSRFGPGRQFANFGAIGIAWLFSEESWLENLNFLSYGKLRASYGTTGNDQIGDYQYLDTYTISGNSYNGIAVMEPSRLFNPSFSWEENKKLEVAMETGFIKDRLFLTVAYFKNRSSNQLVGIPLPGTTGFSSIQANLNATIENKGWEFTLRSEQFKNEDFSWSTTFNLSVNRNRLVSFPGLETSTYSNSYVIGEPLNISKVYQYEGLDSQTGLYQFKDFNDDDLLTRENDREAIIRFDPDFFGGIQNSIRYKGLSVDFLFQFVKQDRYTGEHSMGMAGRMGNQLNLLQDRWKQPGDIATFQPYSSGANSELRSRYLNYSQSNAVLDDASFIRLKNIAISYQLPRNILHGVTCSIVLKGQNLLTFTDYEGLDPEANFTNSLPPLQVLTTGIQLHF
ncbi:SusC/RagA family TonB-linked outer membrane protein [Galbibacter orientalis]|uniref:SusC/RagA family TonB-linked outer membrane protein n=1 Tax=Galbibacter orientalis TaxID=453852 RepID=UPI0030037F65